MSGDLRKLIITWYGHSCFSLDNQSTIIALDPYKPAMIGYPDFEIQAHSILVSHQHEDHSYRPVVDLLPASAGLPELINAGESWPASAENDQWLYRKVTARHDDAGGEKRGDNTIHVLRSRGLTIAHLGDLGHLLSTDQAEAVGQVDLLLLPVGGHFTIDAAQAIQVIDQLQPRNIAPMHYQIGFGDLPISTEEDFLKAAAGKWHIRDLRGPKLELLATDQGNCFVFQYQNPADYS